MLVRFRRRHRRLQASLLESRRVAGLPHPRSEHVAMLGSIAVPMDVAGRLAFWQALHERLARLAAKDHAAEATKAREAAAHAKGRQDRLARGEAVAGGLSRVDGAAVLKAAGWTAADRKHALVVAELERLGLAEAFIKEETQRLHPVVNASTRRRARRLLEAAEAASGNPPAMAHDGKKQEG
jgi:hypothetical protein